MLYSSINNYKKSVHIQHRCVYYIFFICSWQSQRSKNCRSRQSLWLLCSDGDLVTVITVAQMGPWSLWQSCLRWELAHCDNFGLDGTVSLWKLWLRWDTATVTTMSQMGTWSLSQPWFRWWPGHCDNCGSDGLCQCDNHVSDGNLVTVTAVA